MFIYIFFYHNAKTLLIFFKGTYWLRLLGCLIVDPASQAPGSHLLAHFWIFLSHSLHFSCSLLCFFPPSLLTIFSSVHWSYFLLLHMDFFMHHVGREKRLQITNFKSFQQSNPVGKGEVFFPNIYIKTQWKNFS